MKSKLRASNTLLNSAKNAMTRKDNFCFHAETSGQDTAIVTYLNHPSPANIQYMLKLRGPGPSLPFSVIFLSEPTAASPPRPSAFRQLIEPDNDKQGFFVVSTATTNVADPDPIGSGIFLGSTDPKLFQPNRINLFLKAFGPSFNEL
jgi:hypothetical protein